MLELLTYGFSVELKMVRWIGALSLGWSIAVAK